MCLVIVRNKKHFKKRLQFTKQCAKMNIINRNSDGKTFPKVV